MSKCILPWIHQYGELDGKYGLCCFTINSGMEYLFGQGLSPAEAFNSQNMKDTRLAMLRGEKVDACSVCYDWEKNGVQSHRNRMNDMYSNLSFLYDKTNSDGSVKNPPIYLDFRFGNLCNFTCRMCGVYASSSWAREAKHHGEVGSRETTHIDAWTDNDDFWRDLSTFKQHVKRVHFAGGEPFVQEGHYKFLQYMIDHGHTDLYLTYNTNLSYNGSFKGYDIKEMWKHFTKVEVWASIEGYKEKAEYGRKGLEWDLFVKNAELFSDYIQSYSMVSNIYSITSNLELIKWVKSMNKDFFITNLVSPEEMSTTVFSKEVKDMIMKKYKQGLFDLQESLTESELSNILSTLKHMNSRDDTHKQKRFKQKTIRSDLYRNESFESVYPELAQWYINI